MPPADSAVPGARRALPEGPGTPRPRSWDLPGPPRPPLARGRGGAAGGGWARCRAPKGGNRTGLGAAPPGAAWGPVQGCLRGMNIPGEAKRPP
jgi:hypothetical protein